MHKNQIMQIIGQNLLRIRTERGYTQEQLSELAGISTSFYANLEGGKKGVSIFVLRDLAEILEVSVDSLIYPVNSNARLHNINSMLDDAPDALIAFAEKLIRLLKNEFGSKHTLDV